ncbi:MAG: Rrf2 family transcriptional regulator [Bacteroidales bacterium]|nr:Rrf2 family transcriptional regulator [Bacteroidales bacterium]
MILSNTSEYALRILSFMAKDPSRMYSAKYLIESLHISDKYLRRILTDLSKKGFIKSIQGRDGGYVFDKSPAQISFADVIDAVEGIEKYTGCVLGFKQCSDENPCVLHATWIQVREKFLSTVNQARLSDLNFENIYKY